MRSDRRDYRKWDGGNDRRGERDTRGRDDEREERNRGDDDKNRKRGRNENDGPDNKEEGSAEEAKKEEPKKELKAGRTGGAYIPPFKLAQMLKEIEDKSSPEYQRMTWDALRKSINGLVNKVSC